MKRLWSIFTDDMDCCMYTGRYGVERHQCKDAGISDAEIATPDEKRLLKERYGVEI